ncbi:MAG: hypothetical protein A3F16_07755 [Deltaproteobacteria bacterium RIFCSPHIGHO2_12_FULL_43_9]|nr:MAG: hypothetical protein A3F16_07755 [Deltaproteobacteria bacterium RIFCSPHIGHO2_12_FULL_43_9]
MTRKENTPTGWSKAKDLFVIARGHCHSRESGNLDPGFRRDDKYKEGQTFNTFNPLMTKKDIWLKRQ